MDIPESVITTIVTTALGAIGYGFKVLWNRITRHADKCEQDREELWTETKALSHKVDDLENRLESCPTPDCPARHKPPAPQRPDPNPQRIQLLPRQHPSH